MRRPLFSRALQKALESKIMHEMFAHKTAKTYKKVFSNVLITSSNLNFCRVIVNLTFCCPISVCGLRNVLFEVGMQFYFWAV